MHGMESASIAPVDSTTATTAYTDTNSTGHCPLLELPAELRNRIYEYTLGSLNTVWINRKPEKLEAAQKLQFPPLLQTCRQIRTEASGLWYSSITLVWGMYSTLLRFSRLVGKPNFQTIYQLLDDWIWNDLKSAESSNIAIQQYLRSCGVWTRDGVVTARYKTESGDMALISIVARNALSKD